MFVELHDFIQRQIENEQSVLFVKGSKNRLIRQQHSHDFPEIMMQLAGKFTLCCGNDEFLLKPDSLCVIPPGVYHRGRIEEQEKSRFQQIVLGFRESDIIVHKALVSEESAPYGGEKFFLILVEHRIISSMLSHFIHLVEKKENPVTLKLGVAFFLSLLDSAIKKSASLLTRDKIDIALAIIDQYYLSFHFNLKVLADMLEIDANYLSHLFKKKTGMEFTRYLNRKRCGHAVEILKKSQFRICEVAWSSGYQSANYFNRIFKKNFGVSPSLYRKRQIKSEVC